MRLINFLRRRPGGSGRARPARGRDGTTAAARLAVAKARGVKPDNPNWAAALRRACKGGAALRTALMVNADSHALTLAPVIAAIRADGHSTFRAIVRQFNVRGMMTRHGGIWHVSSVRNLLDRFSHLPSSASTS